MDTSPIHVRNTPQQVPARPPAGKPSGPPVQAPADQVNLQPQPPQTPKQLFAALKKLGLDPGRDAAARMTGSVKAGYESLIRFQGEDGHAISLTSREELQDYLALVSGRGQTSSDLKTKWETLSRLSDQGDEFYLKRGQNYVRTDAAGAAIVLARGEAVNRRRLGGEIDVWTSVPAEPPASSESRSKLGSLLNQAEQLKMSFELVPPEPKEAPSIQEKLKQALTHKPLDPVEGRGQLIDALEKGERVLITLPNDKRKVPIAPAISASQLESFLQYLTQPDEQQKAFQESYKSLTKEQAVLMTPANNGEVKGMLIQASDQTAYLALAGGEEVIALTKDGIQHRVTQADQLQQLSQTGQLDTPSSTPPLDPAQPSDNLFMVYSVSPFDPVKKGVYDDLLLRMTEVGSSPQIDIVAMHSDLPEKRNLRVDRVQPGHLDNLKKLDPETVMSDPKVLEDFIAETLLANQTDGKVRLFVGGHGGAEKGLLPDGKHNNAAANHAMSVDDFAGSIHKALDRVEAETGKRPFIDNLMLCSCLMGNTSLIDALSATGDVGILCASPEVMQGSSPNSVIEYLNDPQHSKATGEEFAHYLVDTLSEAPSAPGGSPLSHHADTYGAYRLDKRLARDFQESLDGLFKTCLEHPEQAGAIKRAIAACPTYGINPFVNLMFDIDNRDVIQVAERILQDARVTDPDIKQACEKVIKAAEAQVIVQKVSKNYTGRRGATMYLPVDRFDFDEKMAQTNFLKNTDYSKFLEMIFDAPMHRGVQDTFLTEANRFMEKLKEARSTAPAEPEAEEADQTEGEANAESPKKSEQPKPYAKEIQQIHDLEQWREDGVLARVGRGVRGLVRNALGVAGGLATAVVGAVPGALMGAVLGARAGWTGYSVANPGYGVEEETAADPVSMAKKAGKLAVQGALLPSEAVGLRVNEKLGFRYGSVVGSLGGAVAGLVGGALGGTVAGAALGSIPGFALGRGVGSLATFWIPGRPPAKDHSHGLDSDLTVKE